jgi:hypothetical protein
MLQTSAANQTTYCIIPRPGRQRRSPPNWPLARDTCDARLRRSAACLIMARGYNVTMATPTSLFRLLSEFIVLLLGALLILLAAMGRIGLPSRPGGVVALGAIFIFWGARAATRPEAKAARTETIIRAGSLALVGVFILAVPFVPARHASQLFMLAGGVLVLRGALAAAISVARR